MRPERGRTIGLGVGERGIVDLVRLESKGLTAAMWTAVALMTLSFWVCRFPPMIDYPQHVALSAILRRMLDPSSPERQLYEVNLVTYNGGFHLVVAALSLVVPAELAGKLLVSLYPGALALASLALCRVAGRPRWYALLAVPITWSFAVGWGFANYFMSVPLALLAFTWWLRHHRGERGMLWRLWLASFVLAYAHVFATLCLCTAIGVAGLVEWPKLGDSWGRRFLALSKLPLAVLPAILWCTTVFVHNRYSPHANWEGWDDGLDDPLWYKLVHLTAYAVGNFSDHSDQLVLAMAIATLILIWQSPEREDGTQPLMKWLAVAFFALYCVVPKVFIASWFMFERFPTWVLAFAVPAAPVLLPSAQARFRPFAAAIALTAAGNTVFHMARIPDQADASAILDDIPANRRVVAVTWSNTGQPVILREMWVHLLAYYQVRRPGQIGYSFTKFESMPVHYRLDRTPPQVPGGMEWDARKYDVRGEYARYFDTVLVRTPDDAPGEDPAAITFDEAAPLVKVLSHRGRFWLYDASRLKELPREKSDGVAGR